MDDSKKEAPSVHRWILARPATVLEIEREHNPFVQLK